MSLFSSPPQTQATSRTNDNDNDDKTFVNVPRIMRFAAARDQLTRELNQDMLRAVVDVHNMFSLVMLIGEHARVVRDIDRRYPVIMGNVYAFGSPDMNQLGFVGEEDERETFYSFSKVPHLRGIVAAATGGQHAVALSVHGRLFSWGSGDDGSLGRDTSIVPDSRPGRVKGFANSKNGDNEDDDIVQIAVGEAHTLALTENGQLYFFGYVRDSDNKSFQISSGRGDDCVLGASRTPKHVPLEMDATHVWSGAKGSLAVVTLSDHSIRTFGIGNFGELARSQDVPGSLQADGTYRMDCDTYTREVNGTQVFDEAFLREHYLTPKPPRWNIGAPQKLVTHVACGGRHLLVVAREPGSGPPALYSAGSNTYGQLGHGDQTANQIDNNRHALTRVESLVNAAIGQVAAGESHSLVLSLEGFHIYAFGLAENGELGLFRLVSATTGQVPNGTCVSTPELVAFSELAIWDWIGCGDNSSFACSKDRNLWTWGAGNAGMTGHATDGRNVFIPNKLKVVLPPGYVMQLTTATQAGLALCAEEEIAE